MKYGDVNLNPRMGTLIIKDSKQSKVIVYPRLNQADKQFMNLLPTTVMCTLIIRAWADYLALKQMDRADSENELYLDMQGLNSHLYKRVTLELGDVEKKRNVWLVPATFTALDPYLYDAVTGEVVY